MTPHAPSTVDVHPTRADEVSVARWFAGYASALAAGVVVLLLLVRGAHWPAEAGLSRAAEMVAALPASAKLLAFGLYLSLCCTFLPLPTGWIVAAVAARESAVAPGLWVTVLAVALVGAAASTVANLNDYHLFTLLLRSRRVARVRCTKTYRLASRWFDRSPWLILMIFNVLPLPVDVVRMLAAGARYPRGAFASANFVGRLLRYGVIAYVTFLFDLGWMAAGALLALAVVLAGARLAMGATRRLIRPADPNV
jgi:membrane protein YqaA with SNARE-associated domain